MADFQTSLLREKFLIYDAMPSQSGSGNKEIVALSNRLVLPLKSKNGYTSETFVVRAQNMHTTARMGAQIAKDFYDYGQIMGRATPFDWDTCFQTIVKGYESDWNNDLWVAVYNNGRVVYEAGEANRHQFLDIIEQCDARNSSDYERSMEIAKDAFKQAGKLVTIEHDSNVALVMSVNEDEGKCGVIVRGPAKTTTFNLSAKKKSGRTVKVSECLSVSAAFLEGIQLAFFIGLTTQKIRYDLVGAGSSVAKQSDAASYKLGRLNSAISQFENLQNVNYRPEKPNFSQMVNEAEEFARKMLAKEIAAKIESGELDEDDWVV